MSDASNLTSSGARALPKSVSASRMVNNTAELEGEIAIQSLDRLLGLLAESDGNAMVSLQFGKDDDGKPLVSGEVEADLSVYCQRCLESMIVSVRQLVQLGLVDSEEQAQNLPERLEPLMVVDDTVDLYELVADELLLALPIVSSHAEPCGEQKYMRASEEPRLAPRQTPFKNLANLLGK